MDGIVHMDDSWVHGGVAAGAKTYCQSLESSKIPNLVRGVPGS